MDKFCHLNGLTHCNRSTLRGRFYWIFYRESYKELCSTNISGQKGPARLVASESYAKNGSRSRRCTLETRVCGHTRTRSTYSVCSYTSSRKAVGSASWFLGD